MKPYVGTEVLKFSKSVYPLFWVVLRLVCTWKQEASSQNLWLYARPHGIVRSTALGMSYLLTANCIIYIIAIIIIIII
jgi:hypothetical protein